VSRRRIVALVVAAALGLVAAALGAVPTGASGAHDGHELHGLHAVTARFHSISQADKAGYTPFGPCFESAAGGMGQHYVNDELADDSTVDPLQPEALVYEVRDGSLQLVAVEWLIPAPADEAARERLAPTMPFLYGQQLHDAFPVPFFVLHAWVWRDNPSGTFADYNPHVGACPAA
jgi:hypothetical protein